MQTVLNAIADDIGRGASLTDGARRHSSMFPVLDITMIEVGEESGRLDTSLEALAEWYHFSHRLRQTLYSTFAYPLVVFHAAAFILPVPAFILSQMGVWQYLLMVFSILAMGYVPAVGGYLFFRFSRRVSPLRQTLDRALLMIPLLGTALRDLALSRYCRGFYALYEAGVPMTRCARIAMELCGNTAVARMLEGVSASVEDGQLASDGFAAGLPADFAAIWKTGEVSGSLADSLRRLAEDRSHSAEFLFAQLARWLPRILYFLLMGFLAMSIFTSFSNVMRSRGM